MSSSITKVFVVVDPSIDKQVALERAIITSHYRDKDAVQIQVFVGVDSESANMRANNDNLHRDQNWYIETIKEPLEAAGLSYSVSFSWSLEWQESILQEAKHFGAETIYLPVQKKTNKRRFTFSENKWDLLKTANCPVVLVRPDAKTERKVVLAAVNFQAEDEDHKALNARIIERAKWIAESYGANLHLVNGYRDSMKYPDRGNLVKKSGVASDKIHVLQGYTDEVVAEVATKVNADVVVMGTLGQTGKVKTRRGNTAERVIANLDVDTIVVN
ncbi:universal stress protein [Dasania sp. GY-MA-18]|uniref:Universal stress protein n=1 Tax=Dasania phycosphaerae TaxID=2950436 RepID=A0A9J6RIN3_9GAMM|nr:MULTISPECIES: universal stress protein [Dasania]MCR8921806.1 universal stress protein [Dasania sp. GY-MA-18]MCZ0864234.1 universal stress protein [Dasania phycosphaerae]MCZ0867962.1 universal stress protein [Dasania phycosphaerae]